MKFDFDREIDRFGTDSVKWDVGENELPMWVADMDFRTAPTVIDALEKRLSHGVFGYTLVPDAWYEAYINWWRDRHGVTFEKDWLVFCTGVVPAISSMVRKLTSVGDSVVIQTPVYNIFFNSILNNSRRVLESPLIYSGGKYRMDFSDLEEKLSDPKTTLMILCNPQNPVGKIWDKDTLAKVGELCFKHKVTVISDEIHCDLTSPGASYVPFFSVSETCRRIGVTCVAPTKTFNLAGLQTSAVVVADPDLRKRVDRGLNTDEVAEPNAFAAVAAAAAFSGGGEWLDELREYLYLNRLLVADFVSSEIPSLRLVDGNATYLLWVDVSSLTSDARLFTDHLRRTTGLFITPGNAYGKGGEHFVRINVACPRSRVLDGLKRLKKGAESFVRG
ncbi:MAG: pyridoxal phosphate-dependent aminotransferase [Clostridia bacterium]|nr:pyridoxal phosphate-dependent aminotransferase [Clostridia bacterium]